MHIESGVNLSITIRPIGDNLPAPKSLSILTPSSACAAQHTKIWPKGSPDRLQRLLQYRLPTVAATPDTAVFSA
jgi:hypothetical protein